MINLKMAKFPEDETAQWILDEFDSGYYDLNGIDFKRGDLVVDIGANIGLFCCLLAKRFPEIRILALEPVPETCKYLSNNVQVNGIKNVVVCNLAVTKDGRDVELYVDYKHSGSSSIYEGFVESSEKVMSKSTTLDDILEKLGRVKLLKIDCEGAEYEILSNAKRLSQIDHIRGEFHIAPHFKKEKYDSSGLAVHCNSMINGTLSVHTWQA